MSTKDVAFKKASKQTLTLLSSLLWVKLMGDKFSFLLKVFLIAVVYFLERYDEEVVSFSKSTLSIIRMQKVSFRIISL